MIEVVQCELDLLEAKALELLTDLLEPTVCLSFVSEGRVISVEVDETWSVGDHGVLVGVKELFGKLFHILHLLI